MARRPNILFIMSDDHAAHAISAYGSVINQTPHIDRIAHGGVRLNDCYCTNSICTPSRATILTGQYGHVSGVRTLADTLDNARPIQLQKLLQNGGYRTALYGKWHLGHGAQDDGIDATPAGFDEWHTLPGQGLYFDPEFHTPRGLAKLTGYVSDIITDLSLDWLNQWQLEQRAGEDAPFFLCVHHKAPHREWLPGPAYAHLYEDEEIPVPVTFDDTYEHRPAAEMAMMRIDRDLRHLDLKEAPPWGLSGEALRHWKYQRYIKDYLRCVASVDASVGRLLDWLDESGLADDTIVIYTSDQGFFLGDHGWYDKRFIYEEALKMPFLMRYPRELAAGNVCENIVTNTDFAPTLLDYAELPTPDEMQGVSARAMLRGETPDDWQQSLYYRYWMHLFDHNVPSHYGVRTLTHKLIYFYGRGLGVKGASDVETEAYWELYDLERDPTEMHNVYDAPEYADVQRELHAELERLQEFYGDVGEH